MKRRFGGRPRRSGGGGDEVAEVLIDALAAGGDGEARHGADRLFVSTALPGERWRVRVGRPVEGGHFAVPLDLLDGGGAERAEPPCPHFGRCGGCRLQHLPGDVYAALKRERVVAALARRGLGDVPVEPVRVAPLGSRRRLRLALVRERGGLHLGLRERGSRSVVPLRVCPIARRELERLLLPLGDALTPLLEAPPPVEVSLTAADNGVDLVLHATREPSLPEREGLAALAERLDLARVAWATGEDAPPEPVAERRLPTVRHAGVDVGVPAGVFLQATAFGEAELAAAVAEWGGDVASAADLYAGLGALGLHLAVAGARLHAVEVAVAPAEALRRAANAHRLPVTVEVRDLARRPLMAAELARLDLVLLDPPRAGAAPQAAELAASRVPRIVYASCDPGTFARDARTLVEGGYRLTAVRPIDQFLFSAEVELVAHFARDIPPGRA